MSTSPNPCTHHKIPPGQISVLFCQAQTRVLTNVGFGGPTVEAYTFATQVSTDCVACDKLTAYRDTHAHAEFDLKSTDAPRTVGLAYMLPTHVYVWNHGKHESDDPPYVTKH